MDADKGRGSWALSWIIGGLLKPEQGTIQLNGVSLSQRDRRKEIWSVRRSEIRRWGLMKMTAGEQIRHGLKTCPQSQFSSEAEVIEQFHLTPERMKRYLYQFSHEGWSASCAIGLINGRQIFCFPQIDQRLVAENWWFKSDVDLLKNSGALVIIPAEVSSTTRNLCDEIVPIH